MAHPNSRLKQFELQLADDRRRQELHARQGVNSYGYTSPRRPRSYNTLGPQEDVIERRRHRKRVAMNTSPSSSSRNILMENVILLLILAASIYAIYRLCIYILNL